MMFNSIYEVILHLGYKTLTIEKITVPVTNNSIGFITGPVYLINVYNVLYLVHNNNKYAINTVIDFSSLKDQIYGRVIVSRPDIIIKLLIATPEFFSIHSPSHIKFVFENRKVSYVLDYTTDEKSNQSKTIIDWYHGNTNLLDM